MSLSGPKIGENPQWIHLSKLNFDDIGVLKKSDAKSYFREYLTLCGFDKDDIIYELENFSSISGEYIEDLRADIADTKEEIRECKKNISDLIKQIKLDKSEGKLEGEALSEAIENAEIDIEAEEEEFKKLEEHLPMAQSEMKAIKADWKPFLLKYIKDNTSYGWVFRDEELKSN